MSSPAPILRPAIPGTRSGGGRPPRLGLAIPPSPNVKPVGNQPGQQAAPRPPLPTLHLATPMGSQITPYEQPPRSQGTQPGHSADGGSESSAAHSRSGSFGPLDGRASNPTSAGSQYSALSFASQYGIPVTRAQGTPDPVSAVGSMYSERSEGGVAMERDGSLQGLEAFDQLSLDRARNADVEELDDEGWRIASMEKRIVELGNLGECAGGAVTKCMLNGGKTVFALKVRGMEGAWADWNWLPLTQYFPAGHYYEPRPRRQKANCSRARLQQGVCLGTHLSLLRSLCRSINSHHIYRHGVL